MQRIPRFSRAWRLALLLPTLVLLGACASNDDSIDVTSTPEQMYAEAHAAVEEENFSDAVSRLEALETRYPFSRYAQRAQVELVYVYYRRREWEQAAAAAQRFLQEYPQHPDAAYVRYLLGVVNFERALGFLERSVLPVSNEEMDPRYARASFDAFNALLRRHPYSEYGPDARQRMIFLRNRLANYDLRIAEYYLDRGAYLGAANRAQDLVTRYPGAEATLPALEIMVEAYEQLGMSALATQSRQLLDENKKALAEIRPGD